MPFDLRLLVFPCFELAYLSLHFLQFDAGTNTMVRALIFYRIDFSFSEMPFSIKVILLINSGTEIIDHSLLIKSFSGAFSLMEISMS